MKIQQAKSTLPNFYKNYSNVLFVLIVLGATHMYMYIAVDRGIFTVVQFV